MTTTAKHKLKVLTFDKEPSKIVVKCCGDEAALEYAELNIDKVVKLYHESHLTPDADTWHLSGALVHRFKNCLYFTLLKKQGSVTPISELF